MRRRPGLGGLASYLTGKGLAPRSVVMYTREAWTAQRWFLAHGTDIATVNAVDLVAYVDSRPHTWSTRKLIRSSLSHYWAMIGRRDPPYDAIRMPRKPKMVCRAVEPDAANVLAMAALARGDAKGLAVLMALYLALRRFEIAKVRWDDFTTDGWFRVMGKGDKPATLPVHPALTAALRQASRGKGPWVFPGRSAGSHVCPATIWSWIREVADEAGLGEVPPHILRHTALATANDNLGDLRAVAEFARHEQIETTMGYTRTTAKRLVDVMRSLDYADHHPADERDESRPA